MKKLILVVVLGITLGLQASASDLLIRNAKIHDGRRSLPGSDAVLIQKGLIQKVGTGSELGALCAAPACSTVDAKGAFLIPGLHDAHSHPTSGGAGYYRLSVSGSSVPSIVSSLKSYATQHPEQSWILGRGWYAAGFGSKFPTRFDLDQGESKRPVVLLDSDGHSVWANSAAIVAAGITRQTPDPAGGTIMRDSQGEPSGIFLENAADLIWDKAPEPSAEQRKNYILKGQEVLMGAGFTSFHGGPVTLEMAKTYAAMDLQGQLKMRAFLWLDLTASDSDFQQMVEFAHSLPANGKVHVTAFKGYVDGVISAYTAAMLEPYSDRPEISGEPTIPADDLNRFVLRANAAGFPAALHSIGDRSVRMSLDAFEGSIQVLGNAAKNLGNRIEHIESINPLDAPRFGKLGAVASMQPAHMHFGSASSFYYYPRLGNERVRHTFAWQDVLKGGATLVFGTDYPVVDADPIEGLQCAIYRRFYDGSVFEAGEKVDPDLAMAGFTANPAQVAGYGDRLGRIAPGYQADVELFKMDPSRGQAGSVGENPPMRMWIGGVEF